MCKNILQSVVYVMTVFFLLWSGSAVATVGRGSITVTNGGDCRGDGMNRFVNPNHFDVFTGSTVQINIAPAKVCSLRKNRTCTSDADCSGFGTCSLECAGPTTIQLKGTYGHSCTMDSDCDAANHQTCDTAVGFCKFFDVATPVPASLASDGQFHVCYTTRSDMCLTSPIVYCGLIGSADLRSVDSSGAPINVCALPPLCSGDSDCSSCEKCAYDSGARRVQCVADTAKNGSRCDTDNDVCNGVDTCLDGTCIIGLPPDCGDPHECHFHTCDSVLGCEETSLNCDDRIACTDDSCMEAPAEVTGCVNLPNNKNCDDQDACTNDSCHSGDGCFHSPISCDDGNPCTVDSCNPANGCLHEVAPAGTECRASAGICDPSETCDGTRTTCPEDAKSIAICRSAMGLCDATESCDGLHDDCPVDVLKSAAEVCRSAVGDCDVAETCTGTGVDCPQNLFEPDGMICNDGDACTEQDQCKAGLCAGNRDRDKDGVDFCHDLCPDTAIPDAVPTQSLQVNRFALVNADVIFDTVSPKGKGPQLRFTTTDTRGCSCTQIIAKEKLGSGHVKFGCSISAMRCAATGFDPNSSDCLEKNLAALDISMGGPQEAAVGGCSLMKSP